MPSGNPRTCPNGHTFYKSSDCPVCPVCEAARNPASQVLAVVSAPARRALEHEGILTASQLARYTETEILALHGMGPSSIPRLRKVLEAEGLSFRKSG